MLSWRRRLWGWARDKATPCSLFTRPCVCPCSFILPFFPPRGADVDIVFLQDPFKHLTRDSDVEGMSDGWDAGTACERCGSCGCARSGSPDTPSCRMLALHATLKPPLSPDRLHPAPHIGTSRLYEPFALPPLRLLQMVTMTWRMTPPWGGPATLTPCASLSSTAASSTSGVHGRMGGHSCLAVLLSCCLSPPCMRPPCPSRPLRNGVPVCSLQLWEAARP